MTNSTNGALPQLDLGILNILPSTTVPIATPAGGQVRITFTSSEVGNGNDNDSGTMANQDGGLAVRVQDEDGAGNLTGGVMRYTDEGTRFESAVGGPTFDVRDLVSGVGRGDQFEVVQLGLQGGDMFDERGSTRATYVNAGMGADTVWGGSANDFLVGGAGADMLTGGSGNDSLLGGGGDDMLIGGSGDDTVIYNASTDGADSVWLGSGMDRVNVSATLAANPQVRISFTSAEVGNGNANDAGTLTNQDGGLAVRLQAEDTSGALTGAVSRFDDEGLRFVSATPGVTFDVRDLVSGVARGDLFEVVVLGTRSDDELNESGTGRATYVNAGMGDDTVWGGSANDFLVGGAGADMLAGGRGNDSLLGGGGNDTLTGGSGNDAAIFNVTTDGIDSVNLGSGLDRVAVSATAATSPQVRITFTSAEAGNGNSLDGGALANQDGGLAVRLQAEDAAGNLTGGVSRFDDEGIRFESATAGVTFDVRDLVSGVARGDLFEVVQLGTRDGETFDESASARATYVNAGLGDDTVMGGSGRDFLVGGAGNDVLGGGMGMDSLLGGGGNDDFVFAMGTGMDSIVDFVSGADQIDLSDFGVDFGDVMVTQGGGMTVITLDGIDADDFSITLVNGASVVESDFIFA